MKPYFSLKRIREARNEASKYFLIVPFLEYYSDRKIQKVSNGVGTDLCPKLLKLFFRTFCKDAETCSIFHDIQWNESDGYLHSFEQSNEDFRMNLKILSIAKHRWYSPVRYWDLLLCRILSAFLKLGYLNYLHCYLENRKRWRR